MLGTKPFDCDVIKRMTSTYETLHPCFFPTYEVPRTYLISPSCDTLHMPPKVVVILRTNVSEHGPGVVDFHFSHVRGEQATWSMAPANTQTKLRLFTHEMSAFAHHGS
jgi:hypothetical protein